MFLCLFASGRIHPFDEDIIIGLIEEALRKSDLKIAASFRGSCYETAFAVIGDLRQSNRGKSMAMTGKFQIVRLNGSYAGGLFTRKTGSLGMELINRDYKQRPNGPIGNSPAFAEIVYITTQRRDNAEGKMAAVRISFISRFAENPGIQPKDAYSL